MREIPNFSEWQVQNGEQAIKLVREQLTRVADYHLRTFTPVPTATTVQKHDQRKNYTLLMMEYGITIGLVEMAHKSGLIQDEAYRALTQEAHSLTMPGVVGVIQGGV